jgi:hypothetical protein
MPEPIFTVIDDGAPAGTSVADGHERVRRAQADGRPVAIDVDERAAYLGVSAAKRSRQLASLAAPDF